MLKEQFQHAAARRRLDYQRLFIQVICRFNTQPPEGGWLIAILAGVHGQDVSTRSRPKAAGFAAGEEIFPARGFNTQPPEGGWPGPRLARRFRHGFNTQPPEGGW